MIRRAKNFKINIIKHEDRYLFDLLSLTIYTVMGFKTKNILLTQRYKNQHSNPWRIMKNLKTEESVKTKITEIAEEMNNTNDLEDFIQQPQLILDKTMSKHEVNQSMINDVIETAPNMYMKFITLKEGVIMKSLSTLLSEFQLKSHDMKNEISHQEFERALESKKKVETLLNKIEERVEDVYITKD